MADSNSKEPSRALLASILAPEMTEAENDASLEELGRLCESLGCLVAGRAVQKKQGYGSPFVFGKGRLKEISEMIARSWDEGVPVHLVVFDRELSPLQSRNVENALNAGLSGREVTVSDRTGIIIDIFSKRARSRQARLQIEMARLKYVSPRLRDMIEYHGDRQGGGIGAKGVGETQVELKRRQLRDRLADLRRELESLEKENEARRDKRAEQSVALAGYTNSGKSTLMRALTESDVYVADQLFATLDVTTRQLHPPVVPPILVTDTVGFIRFLPHDLVASFKSTLAEASHADFLLHIVDASDPQFEVQMETTDSVLKELGADQGERQIVFNKIDRVGPTELKMLKHRFPEAWFTSALDSQKVSDLRAQIIAHFEALQKTIEVHVPFSEAKAIGEIHRVAQVLEEHHDENGTQFKILLKPADWDRLKSRFKLTIL